MATEAVGGSFRDPSGHVFVREGRILRQVNPVYAPDYDCLVSSGLCAQLVERGLLVPHREVNEPADGAAAYRVLEAERIPFVSYPCEWSFSQLKSAALATLTIHRAALEHGMVLKDASAYNIQFRGAQPLFIDTLSFERWREGTPWVAYRQFCQHFLGPLALMSSTDVRLNSLSRVFIDGPPLDLVSRLLPFTSRLHPALLVHLHLHARAQSKLGKQALPGQQPGFSKRAMLGLIDHLEAAIGRLKYTLESSTWSDYYANTNYSSSAMDEKRRLIASYVAAVGPDTVWDLGANTGAFSEIAANSGAYTVAFDGDHAAVEQHVIACRKRKERRVLPLVMDLTNPTGSFGWDHRERLSLEDRGPADLVLALGLIHHLSLPGQVPFRKSAELFQRIGRTVIVEFVPSNDSQVQSMLSRMPTAVNGYTVDAFEAEFSRYFSIRDVTSISDSSRRLYLLQKRDIQTAAA